MKDVYTIHLNSNNECMSVRCDFYQTCIRNSVSNFYKTKQKFIPLVIDENQCYSFGSGKRSDLRDNNYPHKFKQFIA